MPEPGGLLGIIDMSGRFIRWEDGKVLTYCVLKGTFTGPDSYAHYDMVVKNMEEAARAWQSACNIQFQHRSELDDSPSLRPDEVLFPVRELDTGGALVAAAFFPNDPIERRRVIIDPSYYWADLGFDPVGVLRHELGHVLGFRHEHIRKGAPPECRAEDTSGTEGLTPFDSKSVMHYLCGGFGDKELRLTELDILGAQRIYGPPEGPAGLIPSMAGFTLTLPVPLPLAFVR